MCILDTSVPHCLEFRYTDMGPLLLKVLQNLKRIVLTNIKSKKEDIKLCIHYDNFVGKYKSK